MNRLKFFSTSLLFLALISCRNGQKEVIEERIRQINGMIALFQNRIDARGAAISNISTLSQEKKEEYHYDSLVRMQELQIKSIKVFQEQVDSLQGVLKTFK
jgi:hypothetical protein